MRFEFNVAVEVERESGKFASRDEIAEQLTEWLEEANGAQVFGVGADGNSEYNVINWDVNSA
jgi:protein involved in ribonucleotide reduction